MGAAAAAVPAAAVAAGIPLVPGADVTAAGEGVGDEGAWGDVVAGTTLAFPLLEVPVCKT